MDNNPLSWTGVTGQVLTFLKAASAPARIVRQAWLTLPPVRHHVLLQPETWELHVGLDKAASDADARIWQRGLEDLGFPNVDIAPLDCPPATFGEQPWVWLKQASDPVLATTAKLLNYQPS